MLWPTIILYGAITVLLYYRCSDKPQYDKRQNDKHQNENRQNEKCL